MKKKLCLLMAMCLLLCLSACGKQPVETTGADKSISDWLAEDKVAVLPGISVQPIQTQPQPTQPVTVETVTVTDAYYEKLANEPTEQWCACKHLPMVQVNGAPLEAVNQALADRFAPELTEYGSVGMVYTWTRWGNSLSLLVRVQRDANDHMDYYAFNIDLLQDRFLTVDEVYQSLGYAPQDGEEIMMRILQSCSDRIDQLDTWPRELLDQMIADTLSQENIEKSQIFAGEDGRLNFVIRVAEPAGGGWSQHLYDETGTEYWLTSVADHLECE